MDSIAHEILLDQPFAMVMCKDSTQCAYTLATTMMPMHRTRRARNAASDNLEAVARPEQDDYKAEVGAGVY